MLWLSLPTHLRRVCAVGLAWTLMVVAVSGSVASPLPDSSPLWDLDNVLITPHTAGETRRYEDNVIDLLLENLERLWRGETILKNQIV